MAADTNAILLYDQAREIWMDLPYNDLRTLCATSRGSTSSGLAAYKELCNDPESWITRAHQKLGVEPRLFWNRSPIEEGLPLPGDSEGRQAQMRYVEIVSRGSGAVIDSVYFISPYEVLVRANEDDNDTLFNQALEMTKKLKLNDKGLGDARYYVTQALLHSSKIVTREGKNRFYRFAPDYPVKRTDLYRDPLYKGLSGELTEPGFQRGSMISADRRTSTAVMGYNRDLNEHENWLGLVIRNDVKTLQQLFRKSVNNIDRKATALTLLFATNNIPLIDEILQLYPDLTRVNHFASPTKEAIDTFGRISDPEVLRLFFARIPGAMFFLAYEYQKMLDVVYSFMEHGNLEMVDEFLNLSGFDLDLTNDLSPDGYKVGSLLRGPHGLEIAEWLLRHDYDIRDYDLDFEDFVISKAVKAYYNA